MYTKKTKKQTKKRGTPKFLKKITRKQWMILGGGAAIAVAIIAIICYNTVFGSYNGLGLSKEIELSTYDMNAIYDQDGFMHYDDDEYESLVGIDVSTFQKKVDWEQVKASGVDFVMIRLGYRGSTDGVIYQDDRFEENLEGAKDAGLEVGVYFFSQAITVEEAEEEAAYVIRHIRGEGVDFPVAFDMEPVSEEGRIAGLSQTQKTEIADAFCTIIKRNGHDPMIYGNPQWLLSNIDISYLTRYDFWLAHYSESTDYPYKYLMWQYSHQGHVSGIDGYVDLNVMFVEK